MKGYTAHLQLFNYDYETSVPLFDYTRDSLETASEFDEFAAFCDADKITFAPFLRFFRKQDGKIESIPVYLEIDVLDHALLSATELSFAVESPLKTLDSLKGEMQVDAKICKAKTLDLDIKKALLTDSLTFLKSVKILHS